MLRAWGMLLLGLLCVAACGGGGSARRSPVSEPGAYETMPAPARGADELPTVVDLLATLDAERAVAVAITAEVLVGSTASGEAGVGEAFAVDLLVARSGAMRLVAPGLGFGMYSDGASLWTIAGDTSGRQEAWRAVAFVTAEPYRALSPFNLAEAFLPTPWTRSESEDGGLSIAAVPAGIWVSERAPSRGRVTRVRRRALLSHDGARVLRRERYDAAGQLDLVVDLPAMAGDPLRITSPRSGVVVSFSLTSLTRDPAVVSADFRPPR